MRISQETAKNIALKMTDITCKKVKELQANYRTIAKECYMATLPKKVLEFFQIHPEYVETNSNVFVTGNGFNREYIDMIGRVPSDNSGCPHYEPNKKDADRIIKAKHEYENAEKAYKQLLSDTQNALLALKTVNQIRQHLPEAEQFLPPPISNSLVVNFDSLQKRLNKQPVTSIKKSELESAK